MMKKSLIFILILFSLSNYSYSEGGYKDPFEPLLPQERKEEEKKPEAITGEREEPLPVMAVEGILFGSSLPQVIIDGEVYKTGDRLKGVDAQVFRIEKNAVCIFYGEKIYRLKVGKKGDNL
jgi:type II secretory pathway component PulC